jgi:alpha-glucosidase
VSVFHRTAGPPAPTHLWPGPALLATLRQSSDDDDGDAVARVSLSASPIDVRVALFPGDDVYGLGPGAVGTATRNGQSLRLMNRDTIFFGIEGATYASFPLVWVRGVHGQCFVVVVLSARPLDVLVDSAAVVFREVTGTAHEAGANHVGVLVVTGATADDIARELSGILGRSFVPPAWALGFHQSRWSYRTAEEVIGVAEAARAHDIPLDVVHLDIHMMDDYRVFSWHPRRFPDPAAMHRRLTSLGVRTLAIIDPGVSTVGPSSTRDALVATDGLLKRHDGGAYVGKVWPGDTVFPDFGRDDVDAIWARAHRTLTDAGVSGFWNDMNDPVFKVGVVYDPLAEDVVHRATAPSDGATGTASAYDEDAAPITSVGHVDKRNLYANDMARATRAGLEAARPAERHFVLSRSGFLGVQQHAALWTGDNFSSWEQLEENLHMVMHLGLSGVPLSGADIGGFGGRRGKYGIAKLKPPAELFVRWLELGALMPFCRVHSVLYGPRQEPWSFSSSVTMLARRILRRRYRLLGLLNTLARQAASSGTPLVRPLWWHDDVPAAAAAMASRQFLLGRDVLSAPVMRDGARRHEVWLPAGRWLDSRDGVVHVAGAGGAVVDADAPLGSPPLFFRGGSVLPWLSPARNAPETLCRPLTLEVVAPQSSSSTGQVVLDDGVSVAGHAAVGVTVSNDDDAGVISGSVDVDVVDGFVLPQGSFILRLPPGFTSVTLEGGQRFEARPRVLQTGPDDGRGGSVSEVELPLVASRFTAR